WRTNVKKFSLQWVLAIHLPVPFVILLRIYGNIGFELYTYPIIVGAFFLGQHSGKKLFTHNKNKRIQKLSSCLIMDYYQLVRNRNQ
ncbi:MAG: hypothetical protein DRJ10_06420, partial [Bacteroidetes bacterium]